MEALAIIPARKGSKGILHKNFVKCHNRHLVEYTFDAALKSKILTKIVLSTDCYEIARLGSEFGIETPFLRPSEISQDNSKPIDYVKHCLDFLLENENYKPNVISILQPSSPLRTSTDIDNSLSLLFEKKVDSVVSVTEIEPKFHPNWQFQITKDKKLQPFCFDAWQSIPSRRQDLSSTYTRNGAVYSFWLKTLLKFKNFYGINACPYIMPPERSVNIDNPSDLKLAESILKFS